LSKFIRRRSIGPKEDRDEPLSLQELFNRPDIRPFKLDNSPLLTVILKGEAQCFQFVIDKDKFTMTGLVFSGSPLHCSPPPVAPR
jgi:hypothetical protein